MTPDISKVSPEQETSPNSIAGKPAPNAPSTPAKAVQQAAPIGMAQKVNAIEGARIPIPKMLTGFKTGSIAGSYFHGMLYGDTGEWKTTTAALFSPPEATLIVLTRQPEQMRPLQNLGYTVALAQDVDAFRFAMTYPERVAEHLGLKTWNGHPEQHLIIDDITEGRDQLLEDADVIDDKEVKDVRRSYKEVAKDFREIVQSLRRRKMHYTFISLAAVKENELAGRESIRPALSPSQQFILLPELDFVFYVKPGLHKLLTDKSVMQVVGKDEKTGREKTWTREIFAKNKLPLDMAKAKVLLLEEPMDLRAIWNKITAAKQK